MQIIAKAILTVLGIYIILHLYQVCLIQYVGPAKEVPILAQILFCASFTASGMLVAFCMIINNDSLAIRMAGPGQKMDRPAQILWLAKSLRIGLVFTGLMLLPQFAYMVRPAGYPLIDALFMYTKAALALYLLCGVPHFVRWQIKRTLLGISNAETTETSNPHTNSPERTPDE